MTQTDQQILAKLVRDVAALKEQIGDDKKISRSDVMLKEIKQQHIDGLIIFKGLEADLPTDGTTQIQAYWATDTGKLYLWDGTDWLSTTLA